MMSCISPGLLRKRCLYNSMIAEERIENTAIELAFLAAQIDEAVGGSFEADSSAASALSGDGVWEYHFETDERWGFVAAGPDEHAETTYPGWGTITVEPNHCAVFYENALAGIVSPHGGRIGGHAVAARDEHVSDLEDAMVDAFRTEHERLTSATDEWTPALASRTEV
jgi:hypothetical protein